MSATGRAFTFPLLLPLPPLPPVLPLPLRLLLIRDSGSPSFAVFPLGEPALISLGLSKTSGAEIRSSLPRLPDVSCKSNHAEFKVPYYGQELREIVYLNVHEKKAQRSNSLW